MTVTRPVQLTDQLVLLTSSDIPQFVDGNLASDLPCQSQPCVKFQQGETISSEFLTFRLLTLKTNSCLGVWRNHHCSTADINSSSQIRKSKIHNLFRDLFRGRGFAAQWRRVLFVLSAGPEALWLPRKDACMGIRYALHWSLSETRSVLHCARFTCPALVNLKHSAKKSSFLIEISVQKEKQDTENYFANLSFYFAKIQIPSAVLRSCKSVLPKQKKESLLQMRINQR